jgi:hypothetical protein
MAGQLLNATGCAMASYKQRSVATLAELFGVSGNAEALGLMLDEIRSERWIPQEQVLGLSAAAVGLQNADSFK